MPSTPLHDAFNIHAKPSLALGIAYGVLAAIGFVSAGNALIASSLPFYTDMPFTGALALTTPFLLLAGSAFGAVELIRKAAAREVSFGGLLITGMAVSNALIFAEQALFTLQEDTIMGVINACKSLTLN